MTAAEVDASLAAQARAAIRAQHPDEARVAVAREFADLLRPLFGEAVVVGYRVKVGARTYEPDAEAVRVLEWGVDRLYSLALVVEQLAKWEVT